MKDKDITTEIEKGGDIITVTIIPSYIYDHMVKKYVICIIKYNVMCFARHHIVQKIYVDSDKKNTLKIYNIELI